MSNVSPHSALSTGNFLANNNNPLVSDYHIYCTWHQVTISITKNEKILSGKLLLEVTIQTMMQEWNTSPLQQKERNIITTRVSITDWEHDIYTKTPISNSNVLITVNQFFNRLINILPVQKKHTLTRKQKVFIIRLITNMTPEYVTLQHVHSGLYPTGLEMKD